LAGSNGGGGGQYRHPTERTSRSSKHKISFFFFFGLRYVLFFRDPEGGEWEQGHISSWPINKGGATQIKQAKNIFLRLIPDKLHISSLSEFIPIHKIIVVDYDLDHILHR
jgi:hypothetical protein